MGESDSHLTGFLYFNMKNFRINYGAYISDKRGYGKYVATSRQVTTTALQVKSCYPILSHYVNYPGQRGRARPINLGWT